METESLKNWTLPATGAHIRFVHTEGNKEFDDPAQLRKAVQNAIEQKPWLTKRGSNMCAVHTYVHHNEKYGSDRFLFYAEDSIKASQLRAFQLHLKAVCETLAAQKIPYVKEIFGWLEVRTEMVYVKS
jgi:hypothetical protein